MYIHFVTVIVLLCIHEVYNYNIDMKFPIIYSKPKNSLSQRNSYFGFSLILQKGWVQVGAPRANSSVLQQDVLEPGTVYRCKFLEECQEIVLERKGNGIRDDNPSIMDLKTHAWIGGAMAMESGENGKIVVCGHRWKNQMNLNPTESSSEEYSMTGICYVSQYAEQSHMHYKLILPPETYDEEDFHKFKSSQIGTSVFISSSSQDGISLLLGAPGAGLHRSGGVVDYMREPFIREDARRRREERLLGSYVKKAFLSEFNFPQNYIKESTYFGYQVTAGYFFTKLKLCHVVSSPRAANLKGTVAVFSVLFDKGEPKITFYNTLEGTSLGGYFGSSLAVADVTGDGLDELIVGEPLFSKYGDEGRIYVFSINHRDGDTDILFDLASKDMKNGFTIGGRFGTSVASLGDIDQDGFEDIAVGAPYEESGVIYIFNGNGNGLSSKIQQIKAAEIHSSIRGFGISISRPADIDGNTFNDIAVGSYISEHVVLLRSHPVIDLSTSAKSSIKQFNASQDKFVVKACFSFMGSESVINNIEVVRNINVDINFHRFKPIPEKSVILTKGNEYCEEVVIHKKEEFDIFKYGDLRNINIIVSQELKKQNPNTPRILWVKESSILKDEFCHLCPVVKNNHYSQIDIQFARDCGSVCKSDAQLECEINQQATLINAYVIGSSPVLKFILKIRNAGDPLYFPKLRIVIPKEVELAHIPSTCEDVKEASLVVTCLLGVIKNKEMSFVNVSLDLSDHKRLRLMSEEETPLSFNASLLHVNDEDPNEHNNNCNLQLKLVTEADVDVKGKSVGDTFFNKHDKKGSQFKHIYEVSNVGVSPIQRVETYFFIPVKNVHSTSSLQFSNPTIEAHHNKRPIFCHPRKQDQNPIPKVDLFKEDITGENLFSSDKYSSNRTLYLNCSSPDVECEIWFCSLLELKQNSTAKIVINPKLNFSLLGEDMGNRDIIYFSSQGHVKMNVSSTIQKPNIETHHEAIVSIAIIGTVPHEEIQLWIVIVCIIVGILLILVFMVGLSKTGFFKRKKKEQLHTLRNSVIAVQ